MAADPKFAKRLRELRANAGLTQYALAKKSGVSAQAISKIEKSEREPGWGTVVKLARGLSVSVAAFDVEPEQPPIGDVAEQQPQAEQPKPRRKRKGK